MRRHILALALLAGCSDDGPEPTRRIEFSFRMEPRCDDSVGVQRAKFIIDCARAANPRSDEEGEDLVEQCESSSTVLCVHRPRVCKKVVGAIADTCAWCSEVLDDPELAGACERINAQRK